MKFITMTLFLAPTDGNPKWEVYQARTLARLCQDHVYNAKPCTVGALPCPFTLDEQAPLCGEVNQEHWLKLMKEWPYDN